MAGIEHGLSQMPIYAVWVNMLSRCYNPRDDYYAYYGGRGITVCKRWHSIFAFMEDMGHPLPGLTIGRIDNNGNYEPGNCRWETRAEQNDNTSRNRFITWQDRTQTVKAWAQELNLDPGVVGSRLSSGWGVERALSTPTRRGFDESRALRLERTRKAWAKNGRRYRRTSLARIRGDKPPATIRRRKGARLTAEVKALILGLRAQGITGEEIARRVGVSRRSVVNVANGHR